MQHCNVEDPIHNDHYSYHYISTCTCIYTIPTCIQMSYNQTHILHVLNFVHEVPVSLFISSFKVGVDAFYEFNTL